MKMNQFVAVFMALLLCLMAGSALAAQFTIDEDGVITAVNADSGIEALVIPAKVENVPVTGIGVDFSGFTGLKYILFEDFAPEADLTAAPALKCVYVTQGITDQIREKISVNDHVGLLQWKKLSNKHLELLTPERSGDKVILRFNNIIPDGYIGYGYQVTREVNGNSSNETVFDSAKDAVQFAMHNGIVTFTDFAEQTDSEQRVRYTITAYDPFGGSLASQPSYQFTIPAKEKPIAAPDSVPATGDEANPLLWAVLIAVSAFGTAMALKRKEA